MKKLVKYMWLCENCENMVEEDEWRDRGSVRQMPRCEVCGREYWRYAGFRECVDGCLAIWGEE